MVGVVNETFGSGHVRAQTLSAPDPKAKFRPETQRLNPIPNFTGNPKNKVDTAHYTRSAFLQTNFAIQRSTEMFPLHDTASKITDAPLTTHDLTSCASINICAFGPPLPWNPVDAGTGRSRSQSHPAGFHPVTRNPVPPKPSYSLSHPHSTASPPPTLTKVHIYCTSIPPPHRSHQLPI